MFILRRTQFLPIDIEKAWDFFSSPLNLKDISPPYMCFDITSTEPLEKMYPGQIITYKVKPLLKWPMKWVTEITHVQKPFYFVDEQRFGPYKFWHHQHHFKEVEGGVEMTDIVYYDLPMGFIGRLFEPMMVRPKLEEIFNYRKVKLEQFFGVVQAPL